MNDYSALAQRVSMSIDGVRGCLLLSRDGMILGAHPEGDAESRVRFAWVRFASVGDPERSYIEFPDQIWAFVRRGGYSAFAVADTGVRPGVLVDLLEQALMMAEQSRADDRETMRLPEMPSAPSGKPRTSLHKQERAPAPVSAPVPAPAPVVSASQEPEARTVPPAEAVSDPASSETATTPAGAESTPRSDPGTEKPRRPVSKEDEPEVDRILLAKEFAGLLQVPKEDDEASR
ncbi:MAG: hypothetical protein H0W97_09630 [Actinobacteria bacterium]|nr:hypothetical protein [Actinomycetota bacterium]